MSEVHKVYVGCCMIILNPDGDKVLIAQRKKEPDIDGWQIPGGTVDYDDGENLIAAASREAFEETGIEVKNPEFVCVMNSFYYGKQRPIHIAFVARAQSEQIPPNPEPQKATDWQWVELNSLPSGKWFRMSKTAVEFYKKLQSDPNINRAWIDPDFPSINK